MRDTGFKQEAVEWVPQTRLGKLVKEGQVTTMGEALASGLPIREYQIVDALLPEIKDEVLDINMVQRMTDSGRRVKFRATVIVGNGDGFIGIGEGKDVQVGVAIRKAIDTAK
ncbi:MAG: 30S ribosomal protein S5, partial [Euryarchaeota archaeon]|nr:30S ribosomal protein S5 [Euryarchaeota archaeon]